MDGLPDAASDLCWGRRRRPASGASNLRAWRLAAESQLALLVGAYSAAGYGAAGDPAATDTRPANADLAEIKVSAERMAGNPSLDVRYGAGTTLALIAKVEALRAVLGPLLEGAVLVRIENGQQQAWCFCCGRLAGFQPRDWRDPEWDYKHEPDCPTLHVDELMGRA